MYYLVFPSHFDLSMSTFIKITQDQMVAMGQVAPSVEELKSLIIMQMIIVVLLAPILNFIACLGEELGWRGFLLTTFNEKYSYLKLTSALTWYGKWVCKFFNCIYSSI